MLQYGPNGTSRGVATVIFAQKGLASKAYTRYNGKVIDGSKRMRIEIIVDPSTTPGLAVPHLASRIAKNDNTPANNQRRAPRNPATAAAPAQVAAPSAPAVSTRGRGRGRGRGGQARRPRKTADELDAEMTDYMSGAPVQTAT